MAETKEKPASSLRTPKPKKLGLSVPPALRLPHEDLINPRETSNKSEEAPMTTLPGMGSQTSLRSASAHSSQSTRANEGHGARPSDRNNNLMETSRLATGADLPRSEPALASHTTPSG